MLARVSTVEPERNADEAERNADEAERNADEGGTQRRWVTTASTRLGACLWC